MRRIAGSVVFPAEGTEAVARQVSIELRDVTQLDSPSWVVAELRLREIRIAPGLSLPFALDAPDSPASRDLILRVHVDLAGTGTVLPGDFLTTSAVVVPASGEVRDLRVPVSRV